MATPAELVLSDLLAKYASRASSPTFSRLYEDDGVFGHMFSVLHKNLNRHFEAINGRARTTRHYWAEDSREFIALIDELNQDMHELKRAGVEVELLAAYQDAIERCEPWLAPSGGSRVPDDFERVEVIKYEPVFRRVTDTVKLAKQPTPVQMSMVGEGSYAHVYSYVDPDYGIKFAVKRAKRDIDPRELERFKQEFEVMQRLSFPYVVEVYRYNDERNEYRMEFCDETLRDYVAKHNSRLSSSTRKRIALQFLYGMNYLHLNGLLHRDISLQNVLVKVFAGGAVLVKLSDFGLVKDKDSDFTRTSSDVRGTIRDPHLESFKDYDVPNEIYAIGWVLSFIFTGRNALTARDDQVGKIVRKCSAHDIETRYSSVLELIADVEALAPPPADATDAPA